LLLLLLLALQVCLGPLERGDTLVGDVHTCDKGHSNLKQIAVEVTR